MWTLKYLIVALIAFVCGVVTGNTDFTIIGALFTIAY